MYLIISPLFVISAMLIPASVAVLTAYARNDSINKWLSPAGIKRGLLPLVTELNIPGNLTEEEMSDLYDNLIPVNVIKYVPNSIKIIDIIFVYVISSLKSIYDNNNVNIMLVLSRKKMSYNLVRKKQNNINKLQIG